MYCLLYINKKFTFDFEVMIYITVKQHYYNSRLILNRFNLALWNFNTPIITIYLKCHRMIKLKTKKTGIIIQIKI
jgi:hypothetical protein